MKQYRHIEHLLKVYYHQLDGLQQRTEHDLQHTRARLQELEALLASDELLPSVGIGHYGLLEGLQQGRHDDATFRGVVLLEREIQCHAEERARLRSWEVKLCGELREYARFRDMVTDVLHALAQTDKETFSFIDAHYREKHSCVDIALATYCDQSTVRRRIERVFATWEPYFHNCAHLLPKSCVKAAHYPPRNMTAEVVGY